MTTNDRFPGWFTANQLAARLKIQRISVCRAATLSKKRYGHHPTSADPRINVFHEDDIAQYERYRALVALVGAAHVAPEDHPTYPARQSPLQDWVTTTEIAHAHGVPTTAVERALGNRRTAPLPDGVEVTFFGKPRLVSRSILNPDVWAEAIKGAPAEDGQAAAKKVRDLVAVILSERADGDTRTDTQIVAADPRTWKIRPQSLADVLGCTRQTIYLSRPAEAKAKTRTPAQRLADAHKATKALADATARAEAETAATLALTDAERAVREKAAAETAAMRQRLADARGAASAARAAKSRAEADAAEARMVLAVERAETAKAVDAQIVAMRESGVTIRETATAVGVPESRVNRAWRARTGA